MAARSLRSIGLAIALGSIPWTASGAEPDPLVSSPPVKLAAAPSPASDAAPPAAAAEPATDVPLSQVVLFSSGVGFFDRQGQVEGDAALALKFNAADINDLLKSLVLEDRGGGQISAVNYGSKDPITKTLKKFAIDLTANPTLSQILNQIRGERIEFAAPLAMTGTLLGVETRKREIGTNHETVNVEIMNVLTDDGLRSIPLDQVGAIKLSNAQLDKEFRQALAVLALGHDADKKSVTLHFSGKGKRPVRVGYIQNMPIWKTSYRLVLSDDGKPKLQGWAIVENTTEEDWKDVHLTLVSGRPVSFVMNLYDPLYVQRPMVEPELFAGLRPQVYGQSLLAAGGEGPAARPAGNATLGGLDQKTVWSNQARKGRFNDAESVGGYAGFNDDNSRITPGIVTQEEEEERLGLGVASVSEAGDVGEMFQYSIKPPVTLARQESAMLPIVNERVKTKKLSIYNWVVQPKHPLCGLRLTNTTDLHLMQGPITVFDGGTYAGDARIEDIAPGGNRLLTYALDLDVECNSQASSAPEEIASVSLKKGVLHAQRKQVRTRKYTIKNSDKVAKTVLIEHPRETDWQLITPKEPSETSRLLYRFAVEVEPGKSAELEVVEEHMVGQQLEIASTEDATIRFFQSQKVVSEKTRAALEQLIERKAQLARLVAERQQFEQQKKVINEEQQRIRQNMPYLDRNSDLFKRYVKKLDEQETTVEKLETEINRLAGDETQRRNALDEFLRSLDLS